MAEQLGLVSAILGGFSFTFIGFWIIVTVVRGFIN